ncbi:MAG: DUF1788 domain-containing protein [Devosia sp.]|uniref:DUF1788 domain-containing protein n=1 Tax=Devosia sp. TaxID=1871048 RepID=UPI001A49F1FF|nr:DUF1788 domain-containing protein [Devosia sp.]MBL8596414.1 DUF1788 domain-containing protein [Devosia sp.]
MDEVERFDHLVRVITSNRFLSKQGLGNEVPFFICAYPASDGMAMEAGRRNLIKQVAKSGVRVLDLNLLDLSVEILRERGIFDRVLEMESGISKGELLELLQGVLDPAAHLVPRIARAIESTEHDVIFLSGIGEVYPFIRSHNVLNNLQSTAKDRPTVMFFPGEYSHALATGAELVLFGVMRDDKYYRAFNILNFEV